MSLIASRVPSPPGFEPPLVDPDYADEAAFVAELDAMAAAGCFDVPPPRPEDELEWRELVTAPPGELPGD